MDMQRIIQVVRNTNTNTTAQNHKATVGAYSDMIRDFVAHMVMVLHYVLTEREDYNTCIQAEVTFSY